MKRFALLAVVACLCGCALAGTGRAEFITYTETFTASGSLGSLGTFTNAQVTVTFTGDTANVSNNGNGFFDINTGTATVNVTGLGMATFTSGLIHVGVFQHVNLLAFSNGLSPLVELSNSSFATYDLTTSIGPLSGGATSSTNLAFPTNLGDFELTSHPATATVTATTSTTATPEPASLTLLGIGVVGMIGYSWRRRKQAKT